MSNRTLPGAWPIHHARVVERRKPLSDNARRSGWVGSNILPDRVPEVGRIELVVDGEAISRESAVTKFEQMSFLAAEEADTRDWTTAIMDCIDDLDLRPGETFALAEVYRFEDALAKQYPDNQHIRAKIRQQLQVLRDEDLIEFLGDGEYRLRWVDRR